MTLARLHARGETAVLAWLVLWPRDRATELAE